MKGMLMFIIAIMTFSLFYNCTDNIEDNTQPIHQLGTESEYKSDSAPAIDICGELDQEEAFRKAYDETKKFVLQLSKLDHSKITQEQKKIYQKQALELNKKLDTALDNPSKRLKGMSKNDILWSFARCTGDIPDYGDSDDDLMSCENVAELYNGCIMRALDAYLSGADTYVVGWVATVIIITGVVIVGTFTAPVGGAAVAVSTIGLIGIGQTNNYNNFTSSLKACVAEACGNLIISNSLQDECCYLVADHADNGIYTAWNPCADLTEAYGNCISSDD